MEADNQQIIIKANSYLVSSGLALYGFWILNVFKEAYQPIKDFLSFYGPIGPLLGLFVFSTAAFVLFLIIFNNVFKIKNQTFSFWFFVVSTLIFPLLVFPPVFGTIAG